jgi:hypothetical protein
MGDQVKIIRAGADIPVEPVGALISEGWMPGTWVKLSSSPPVYSPGVVATVERSDGTGYIAGFLMTGPQHKQAVVELSDMWTTDTRQREGGDTHADWSAFDAGGPLQFDKAGQLQRLGSRVASLKLCDTTVAKFYVYETLSYSARHGGPGGALVYVFGNKLYVSENGLLTKEKEQVGSVYLQAIVGGVGSDSEGNFVLMFSVLV